MLLCVLKWLAGCCVLMPYLRDCSFYSRSPVYSQDNGVAKWLCPFCSSQRTAEVLVKFHWEFWCEIVVGVPRHDPRFNFQSYIIFVERNAHRQMSHKCDVKQRDSICCNRTASDSLDNRFPRIREGHPATAPPIPSSTSDHSGLAWITAPISPKWLFGTIQLFLTSASEGAHMLIDSDFNNEFKRQEMFVGQLAVLWHSTVEQSFIHFFLVKIAASQGYCWLRGLEWTQPGP